MCSPGPRSSYARRRRKITSAGVGVHLDYVRRPHVRVAIGSRNPVKVAATQAGFEAAWPSRNWIFEDCDVSSGVSDQPMSNGESILGARNRAVRARNLLCAGYGVGIESGLEHI